MLAVQIQFKLRPNCDADGAPGPRATRRGAEINSPACSQCWLDLCVARLAPQGCANRWAAREGIARWARRGTGNGHSVGHVISHTSFRGGGMLEPACECAIRKNRTRLARIATCTGLSWNSELITQPKDPSDSPSSVIRVADADRCEVNWEQAGVRAVLIEHTPTRDADSRSNLTEVSPQPGPQSSTRTCRQMVLVASGAPQARRCGRASTTVVTIGIGGAAGVCAKPLVRRQRVGVRGWLNIEEINAR